MYRVPQPQSPPRTSARSPQTIDVLTDDELRARRFRRWMRVVIVAALGGAGWYCKDRVEWSDVRGKAETAWMAVVESFHDAFPSTVRPSMKKGEPPTNHKNNVPAGGTVSPVGRSQRVPVPGAGAVPKAGVVECSPGL